MRMVTLEAVGGENMKRGCGQTSAQRGVELPLPGGAGEGLAVNYILNTPPPATMYPHHAEVGWLSHNHLILVVMRTPPPSLQPPTLTTLRLAGVATTTSSLVVMRTPPPTLQPHTLTTLMVAEVAACLLHLHLL